MPLLLNAFQEMVTGTLRRNLGANADGIIARLMLEMGITVDQLEPRHMPELSRRLYDATATVLEEHQRKFLAGTVARFEHSKVNEMNFFALMKAKK